MGMVCSWWTIVLTLLHFNVFIQVFVYPSSFFSSWLSFKIYCLLFPFGKHNYRAQFLVDKFPFEIIQSIEFQWRGNKERRKFYKSRKIHKTKLLKVFVESFCCFIYFQDSFFLYFADYKFIYFEFFLLQFSSNRLKIHRRVSIK